MLSMNACFAFDACSAWTVSAMELSRARMLCSVWVVEWGERGLVVEAR